MNRAAALSNDVDESERRHGGLQRRLAYVRALALLVAAVASVCVESYASACDLAFVMDHSGSMGDTIRSSGRSRCADASCYASTAFNYYRCGAASCTVTTAATPVDYFANGTTNTNDLAYNILGDNCSTISGKRVNVFTFNGTTGFHSVTLGIGTDPEGWVSLSDNAAADAVLAKIGSLATGCEDTSPLADALCAMPPLGDTTIPMKKMKILTDGGENASTGACSGPEDPTGSYPFSASSWEGKVYQSLAAPTAKWCIDTTLFVPATTSGTGDGGSLVTTLSAGHSIVVDSEKAVAMLSANYPTVEINFFTQLDSVTYGNTTVVTDNSSIAPCQMGRPAPAAPSWAVACLAIFLATAGITASRRLGSVRC